ncbi:MAG: LacI family DNA-binding transcriptional regulator [Chloroflexota bacterium]
MATRVTIADIARRAGVSKTTVSRVLNDKPDVDANTRERILSIIEETGYVPNPAATGLVTGSTKLLGLLVSSLYHPWVLEIIRGVAKAIEDTAYELVLYTTSSAQGNQELFARALNSGLTDGLVVMLPPDGEEFLSSLYRGGFPIVLIDDRGLSHGLPCVKAANQTGAYEATRHLISLGHREIGFVNGPEEYGCCRERLVGYRLALEEAGLAFSPQLIRYGDFSQPAGFAIMEEWLGTGSIPSAVFVGSDEMAFGALEAIKARGLRVPDDIAIVGFDDVPLAARADPPLTSVCQPLHAMGAKAMEMLLEQIAGKDVSLEGVELETELVVRESCGYRDQMAAN